MRLFSISLLFVATVGCVLSASAQKSASGSVIEHTGEAGELIVSRDGTVYWLSTGDDLFEQDIVRALNADSAVVTFRGCVMTLPEKEDIQLDDEFCALVVVDEPSIAMVASEGGSSLGANTVASGANAPLIVGGVVLSAGGILAATNGGNGGTGSDASVSAGAPQATTASGS